MHSRNTVHFAIRMEVATLIRVVGGGVRGRRGWLLILRLAPRGTCLPQELATRSSRISAKTSSCRASLCRGGKSRKQRQLAPHHAHRMQERQPARAKRCERVRVPVGPQRRPVHEPAHGEMRQQQAPELLTRQVRGRARAARPAPRAGASSARPARPRSPSVHDTGQPGPRQAPAPGREWW